MDDESISTARALADFRNHPDRPGITLIGSRELGGFDVEYEYIGYDGTNYRIGRARLPGTRHIDAAPGEGVHVIEEGISKHFQPTSEPHNITASHMLDALTDPILPHGRVTLTIGW